MEFLKKNRVRWNFTTVFGFKKTVLDRIPGYKRTVLKEECLYIVKATLANLSEFKEGILRKNVLLKLGKHPLIFLLVVIVVPIPNGK